MKHRSYGHEVKGELQKLLWKKEYDVATNEAYVTLQYNWCLAQLGYEHPQELEEEEDGKVPSFETRRKDGLVWLNKTLERNPDSATELASDMYKQLQQAKRLKTTLKPPKIAKPYIPIGPERKIIISRGITGKPIRERKEWAKEEEEIFIRMADAHATPREIADALYIRTPDDVRLHNRYCNEKRAQEGIPPRKLARTPKSKKKTNRNETAENDD